MKQVECLEKQCEIWPSRKVFLFTDLKGDPICCICHSPAYVMLVAELESGEEIVGLIRYCIELLHVAIKFPLSMQRQRTFSSFTYHQLTGGWGLDSSYCRVSKGGSRKTT
ncbi:hypothetical protein SUGI_1106130 [Cryptomeria japonica]|nr:hypothetical protein SUGI_1106130 [Cryptomeria japonica]